MKPLISILFLLTTYVSSGQSYKEISIDRLKAAYYQSNESFFLNELDLGNNLTALFQELDTVEKEILIQNCKIQSFKLNNAVFLKEFRLESNQVDSLDMFNASFSEASFVDNTINYTLNLDQCLFRGFTGLSGNTFGQKDQLWYKDNLIIKNSVFYYEVIFLGNSFVRSSIEENQFNKNISLAPFEISQWMLIANNSFERIAGSIEFQDTLTNKSVLYKNQFSFSGDGNMKGLSIIQNKFLGTDKFQTVEIAGNFGSLILQDNTFESMLDLGLVSVEKEFRLIYNKANFVSFGDMSFSETSNTITWPDIANFKLLETIDVEFDGENADAIGIHPDSLELFFAQTGFGDPVSFFEPMTDIQDPLNQRAYDQLLRNYYQLYSIQKQNGNIRSANAIYREMQELEGLLLRYLHRKNPDFNSFFRLQLNRLMGFYTDHGTNPAKSIAISIYIIFAFGIFYFFYPSEWDKESKRTMFEHYKTLVHKDGKYFRPFLNLALGVLLSLINGLVLSLNAFVTLGFGRIPTMGLAKYACIIQGFIGWFLLTLFTVTLINQVQF